MDTAQNQDACFYFIRSILPKIRAREKLKFRIVGNASNRVAKMFRKYEAVEVTGRVDEIRHAIDTAVFCGVCPVQAGAGIQNKVLNYLALGLPCIVSRVGVEGIDAEPGKDLLVFNNAEEAAQQILSVYYDSELRTRLAFAGRKTVEDRFSVHALRETITKSAARLLAGTAATQPK
jgi:glycosyltransferase involved in cell wall biosynthesis